MDGSTPLVLKLYGRKRSGLRAGFRRYLSPFDVGQSSSSIHARIQTEREVLALWQREGFDVPKIYSPAFLEGFDQPCLAMELIPGQTLTTLLHDTTIPLDRKKDIISRFCQEMARRHERALEQQETRLLLFHPNMSRILISMIAWYILILKLYTHQSMILNALQAKKLGVFCMPWPGALPRSSYMLSWNILSRHILKKHAWHLFSKS